MGVHNESWATCSRRQAGCIVRAATGLIALTTRPSSVDHRLVQWSQWTTWGGQCTRSMLATWGVSRQTPAPYPPTFAPGNKGTPVLAAHIYLAWLAAHTVAPTQHHQCRYGRGTAAPSHASMQSHEGCDIAAPPGSGWSHPTSCPVVVDGPPRESRVGSARVRRGHAGCVQMRPSVPARAPNLAVAINA